ncbi:hypothetical protein D3OALGB2SA_5008 [Olavius algarvensis associated proteobacterium Delta 3]|nr:hypothetical protein D3OALGB2SA_5008 [Olavius algarvensis associated proteobacterium Delta 3]
MIIGYLSARVVYEHLATKTMRFNGYLGNSPLTSHPLALNFRKTAEVEKHGGSHYRYFLQQVRLVNSGYIVDPYNF